MIELSDGGSVISEMMLLGQSIMIQGRQLLVDLIVFEMPDFDMILGMDFLGRYGAEIDCKKKKVRFNLDSGDQFEFGEGHIQSLMINMLKASKMLKKGCT